MLPMPTAKPRILPRSEKVTTLSSVSVIVRKTVGVKNPYLVNRLVGPPELESFRTFLNFVLLRSVSRHQDTSHPESALFATTASQSRLSKMICRLWT